MKFTKNEAGVYVNDKNNLVIWQTDNYKEHGVTRYGITDTTNGMEIPIVRGTKWTRGTLAECKRRVKEMQNELNALDKTETTDNEQHMNESLGQATLRMLKRLDINKPLPEVEVGPTSTEPIMHFGENKSYDEWLEKLGEMKGLLEEILDKKRGKPTSIKPMIDSLQRMQMAYSMSPPQFIQETPAMRAAVEQWKRQKLDPEQLERLREIAKKHANPPTHEGTDLWTE